MSRCRHFLTVHDKVEPCALTRLPFPAEGLFAGEVRGVVWIAGSPVLSHLRIGTKRPRAVHLSAGEMRSEDLIGSPSVFDPALQGARHAEDVRSLAAATVIHARNHEQPDRLRGL